MECTEGPSKYKQCSCICNNDVNTWSFGVFLLCLVTDVKVYNEKCIYLYMYDTEKISIYLSHYLNRSENTSPHVTHINISTILMSRMCEGDVIVYVLLFVVLWDNLCHHFCHFLQCFKNILFITFAPDWFDVWENLGTVQKFILNQLHKE